MNYIMSDLHNDSGRLKEMLKKIAFSENDHLFILGDLFDRSEHQPDPLGVYFTVLSLGERCTVIRGNHDHLLATYIRKYVETPERKRRQLPPYAYNSFSLLQEKMTEMDLICLADWIMAQPLQMEIVLGDERYLFAHAMTANPMEVKPDEYYLEGVLDDAYYLEEGIGGYISVCGHQAMGRGTIWHNAKQNVYMCDCGAGYRSGKLGCLCLETKNEFYV